MRKKKALEQVFKIFIFDEKKKKDNKLKSAILIC